MITCSTAEPTSCVNLAGGTTLAARTRTAALLLSIFRLTTCFATCVALSGCASYSPEHLGAAPDLRNRVGALMVPPADLPLPVLRTHPLDLRRPLDMDAVATLAVVADPDLRAIRARVGVSRAQAFQAGILPNPQFTFDYGFLTGGPGTANAYALGLAQDVVPLLTLSTRKAAAEADARGVELDVLWQEWQVVSQARLLYARIVSLDEQRRLLVDSRRFFDGRYTRSNAAMQKGDEIITNVAADLVTLSSIESQLDDTEQMLLRARHDLAALLGVKPDAPVRLAGAARMGRLEGTKLLPRLADLAGARPDILALKIGYAAEEERVRQTIIEQFPKLAVGTTNASDTTAVKTQSLSVALTLPLFDRNQGNIAIEAATRERLKQEYQARLDAAYAAAARLISEIAQAEEQMRRSAARVDSLQQTVAASRAAFEAGNLDGRTAADLQTSLVTAKLTLLKLRQGIRENRVTLQTLIGSALPETQSNAPSL